MKRCAQCGTEVTDDLAVACPNCGSTFAPSGQRVPTSSTMENVYFQPSAQAEKIPFTKKLLRALRLEKR